MHEEGLDILERFFGRGQGKRDWVEHDPDYDCVREHRASRRCSRS